ncbi:hypothetical protein RhiirB3_408737 [Rhizophagus irregularis]|nr:hypothetical protein RhiirB3_408737 [Rhizophagus irregularis]
MSNPPSGNICYNNIPIYTLYKKYWSRLHVVASFISSQLFSVLSLSLVFKTSTQV